MFASSCGVRTTTKTNASGFCIHWVGDEHAVDPGHRTAAAPWSSGSSMRCRRRPAGGALRIVVCEAAVQALPAQ